MELDDEFMKVEEDADEIFKAELDEKHDTFVRGVFHQYVQWTLREKARKENISAGEYRDRLLMAQDVTHKFHRAVHSFGAYDWPKHTHFWHHQRVDVVRAGDESRGFTIDRNELREVAANYLSHPEIQNDPTDWYLMDALVFAVLAASAAAQTGPQQLPAIKLSAGMHIIRAELAQTPEERSLGLMFRKAMGTNDGMLFAFEEPGQQCFWMKNTLLPLSVAFVADDGTVVNIDDMKPQTLDSHCSTKPVRFVLEMNDGWFVKRGIKAGSKLQGTPFVR